ncbi:MAG: DUF2846 domain-containing protein [Leptothrix sp. (in: b-proteobacteria)]
MEKIIYTTRHLLLTLVLFVSACASVPTAQKTDDESAKKFIPSADRASLYIYRDEFFGSALASTVSINGKTIGQSLGKSFFLIKLVPGTYSITAYPGASCELTIDVHQGKNYFVWQESKFAINLGMCQLHAVDENTGQRGVLSGELLSSPSGGIEIQPLPKTNGH